MEVFAAIPPLLVSIERRSAQMASRQGASMDRKKLMADPIMVTTIVVRITFRTLCILYPLAILLVDSV